MTITELGAKLKRKHPEYASLSNEAAGRALLKKYPQYQQHITETALTRQVNNGVAEISRLTNELLSVVDVPLEPPVPTDYSAIQPFTENPIAFVGTRDKLIRKQISIHNAQFEKQLGLTAKQFEVAHQDEKLRRQYQDEQMVFQKKRADYILAMLDVQLAAEVSRAAAEKGVDRPTYILWQVQSLTARVEVGKDAGLKANERAHKEEMDRIEREHERIQAEQHFQLTTEASMANWQREKALRAELHEAFEQLDLLEADTTMSAGRRSNMTWEVTDRIRSLQERIRELGVKADDRKANAGRGTQADSDSDV